MLAGSLSFVILIIFVHAGPLERHPALKAVNACPLFCAQDVLDQMCGSDGRTYDSMCEFHLAKCRNPRLQIAFSGQCPVPVQSRGIICTTPWCWPLDEPVCGSDRLTYKNQCELNNAMCDNESLKTEHQGPCNPATSQ
ncbi:serine protease inhibitor dipetalogastin-like [Mercenaria mercenaria]|uniref:serine protease inhibitor dipetalogastin-like n=1 Tax=Mercenaria mercenaria TaxID=6596 RepID=UPI00234ED6FB|nr:serine protease inhibitor dipetalogastin-like [Mercenaria mercenaria]